MCHVTHLFSRIPYLRGSQILTRCAARFTITPTLQHQTTRDALLVQPIVKSNPAFIHAFTAFAQWQRVLGNTPQRASRLNRKAFNPTPTTVNHRISNPPGEDAA